MRKYEEICSELCELLQPLAPEGSELNENTELVADLGLSSMKILDLLMEVEDRFDVTVPMNILPDINTVRDFAVQLEKLIRASG